jgi:hypothetical protein
MTEYRPVLERVRSSFPDPEMPFEGVLRRRDQRQRRRRIAAGVVGIAVFVAAVWIVTSVASLDRSETAVVPGGDVTGPAETGRACSATFWPISCPPQIGPTVTGPTGSPDAEWNGFDLPPEGAAPSSPETGNVIARFKRPIGPFGWVFVYADGRVLSVEVPGSTHFVERRLSPEGVELVRSGAVEPRRFLRPAGPSLPAGAWADPDARPFVSSRYAVCYAAVNVAGEFLRYVDPSRVVSLLPAQAQDLLRGKERYRGDEGGLRRDRRCSELTIEEARSLEQILLDAGFEGYVTPEWAEAFGDNVGDEVLIFMSCNPLFPHELSG